MSFSFGSVFAGIGGFDKGLEDAGMTCKWQIEMSTPYEVIHPVSLLARAMGPEQARISSRGR